MKEIVTQYIEEKRGEMTALLETLVNIDSGSYTIEGVKQVAATVQPILEELGFSVRYLDSPVYAPHLLAELRGTGSGRILFLGHMDTVFEEGTAAKRPFTVKDGKAYGPGVCDMKCGIVCLLYALKALHQADYQDFGSLTVLLNTDEERGSATSEQYIIQQCRQADMALVAEPGMPGDYVVIERQGGGIFNLEIRGKASHAGAAPQSGIHAIEEAARKILALHALTDYEKGTSVSVGVIHGGTRSNVIPERVRAEIDIRSRIHADGQRLIEAMREICDTAYVPGTKSTLTQVMYRPPIERTAGNLSLFRHLQAAARQLDMDVKERYCGGGSDGNYTSAEGIPTIDSLGPIGEFEHTDDEYIVLETLFSRACLLALFIRELTEKKAERRDAALPGQ